MAEDDYLDVDDLDEVIGDWLARIEFVGVEYAAGDMPDVPDVELVEKGSRSEAGRIAARARWGNRGGGGPVTPDQVAAAFEGTYTTDKGVKFSLVATVREEQNGKAVAGGDILAEDGTVIGEWGRGVNVETGALEAQFLTVGKKHDPMGFKPEDVPGQADYRGAGIATEVQRQTERAARDLGLDTVTVKADQDGALAWAQERFGFRYAERPYLPGIDGGKKDHAGDSDPAIRKQYEDVARRFDSPDPSDWPAPHEVLSIGKDGPFDAEWGGKSYGEHIVGFISWRGVKPSTHVTKDANEDGLFYVVVEGGEQVEKGSRSEAGRKAARARWGNRGPDTPEAKSKRSEAARRAAATRRANREAAAGGKPKGPETDEQKAARMGAEFKAKRSTGEPIEAIDELANMDYIEASRFVNKYQQTLGLERSDDYHEKDVLIKALEMRQAAQQQQDASYRAMNDENRSNVTYVANRFSSDGTVMCAMPSEVAVKIMGGDRAKSQFETGRSKGALYPEARARQETAMLNLHPGVDAKHRPTYGYMSIDDPTSYGPRGYGEVRFELSASVRSRTTMTLGDSLGSPSSAITLGSRVSAREAVGSLGWGIAGSASGGDLSRVQRNGYVEAQTKGGWSVKDVTKVYVPKKPRATAKQRQEWDSIVKAAEDAGIPVERYDVGVIY